MPIFLIVIVSIVVVSFIALGVRVLYHWRSRPCPPMFIWLLKNPFSGRYRRLVLDRLRLSPGMAVLDAGCGPGLLTLPVAEAVGSQGHVTALDIQAEMLRRARQTAEQAGLTNITFLQAGLGEGKLPAGRFDRALLVTVLGEIPDRNAALSEILASLKPGGFLSITEVFPDPDYQSRSKVKAMAREAGFHIKEGFGNWFMFTENVEKPLEG